MQSAPVLDVRPEVAAALQADRPVIAMVSGPIAHTLPWPANLDTVRQAEAAARAEGATLAVVAVWKGRLTVGLEPSELEPLAKGGTSPRPRPRALPPPLAPPHTP